jgi:putative phosphoesterase
MHKIAVISDSHGARVRLEMFKRIAEQEKYDMIIHCGDGAYDTKWLAKNLDIEVKAVAGNCDFYDRIVREYPITVDNVRMLALHGDKYDVKWGLTRLSYYAEERNVNVVLFGHTHQAFAGFAGGVMMVNPGALKDGRYAELHISNGDCVPFLKYI